MTQLSPTFRTPSGPLTGVRIVELAAMGPVPYAAMLLADMGADVILIDRSDSRDHKSLHLNILNRGRRSIVLNLKDARDIALLKELVKEADALLEGYRPGVVERLGIGPDDLAKINPKLVYGRMTGWGQDGPNAQFAGHDLAYIAVTGALDAMRHEGQPPQPPLNLLGDFGGGSMFLVTGILAALLEAQKSGKGQTVDAAMIDGVASLTTLFYGMRATGNHYDEPGRNLLAGEAPSYHVYETLDGKFMAVCPTEPEFFAELCRLTGVDPGSPMEHMDQASWPTKIEEFARVFKTRTRAEWTELMELSNACTVPVLSFAEAPLHPQMVAREVYTDYNGLVQPAPAPRFSRTPSAIQSPPPEPDANSAEILREWLQWDEARIAHRAGIGSS